jgi:hypothetical protein
MNIQVVSTIIQAGTELLSEIIRNRAPASLNAPPPDMDSLIDQEPIVITRRPQVRVVEEDSSPVTVNITPQQSSTRILKASPQQKSIEAPKENKATAIPTGCIPCSLGHVGTCTGLLNEATRFARGPNGAQDPEVLDRVNMCLDELNSLEREDLRPEKVSLLSGWERDLAEKVLNTSRATRHKLEDVRNINTRDLENIAGETQAMRQEMGREWFQSKIANLSQEDQEKITARVKAKLTEIQQQAANGELPEIEGEDEE